MCRIYIAGVASALPHTFAKAPSTAKTPKGTFLGTPNGTVTNPGVAAGTPAGTAALVNGSTTCDSCATTTDAFLLKVLPQ